VEELRASLLLIVVVTGALLRLDALLLVWMERRQSDVTFLASIVLAIGAPILSLILNGLRKDPKWERIGRAGQPMPFTLAMAGMFFVSQIAASFNFVMLLFLLDGPGGGLRFFGPNPDQSSFPPTLVLLMVSYYTAILLSILVPFLGTERIWACCKGRGVLSTTGIGAVMFLSVNLTIISARYALMGHGSPTPTTFFQTPDGVLEVLALTIPIVFIAPMIEEIVFRGAVHWSLSTKLGPVPTIIITATLFGISHMDPASILPITALGAILGWTRHRSGSIVPGLILHSLNNLMALAFLSL